MFKRDPLIVGLPSCILDMRCRWNDGACTYSVNQSDGTGWLTHPGPSVTSGRAGATASSSGLRGWHGRDSCADAWKLNKNMIVT